MCHYLSYCITTLNIKSFLRQLDILGISLHRLSERKGCVRAGADTKGKRAKKKSGGESRGCARLCDTVTRALRIVRRQEHRPFTEKDRVKIMFNQKIVFKWEQSNKESLADSQEK